jgi:hypothetical protein
MMTGKSGRCVLRVGVVGLLAAGLLGVGGCSAPGGADGQGGFGAFVAGAFMGRRAGYGLNEGADVTTAEGLRAVPYVAYVPEIVQGLAAGAGRTAYEAMYEDGVSAAGYGGYSLDALAAAKEAGVIADPDFQTMGKLLAHAGHLRLDTIVRCQQLALITDAERKQLLTEVVKPGGKLSETALELHPQNKGLCAAALEAGALTKDDLRQWMQARLKRPGLLSTDLVAAAAKAGAIDDPLRKACLDYILCRMEARILTDAQRAASPLLSPADCASKMTQVSARKAKALAVINDYARKL